MELHLSRKLQERRIYPGEAFSEGSAATLIKKCNDFGADGVAVAVGELAESLDINLDKVRLKYDGLNEGEIALSESQERMISSTINEAAVTKEKKEKELDNLITTDLALATAYNKMITAKKAIDTAQDAIHALRLARKNTTELNTYYQDYLNAQTQYQEALASFEELKDRPVDDFDRQMAASISSPKKKKSHLVF